MAQHDTVARLRLWQPFTGRGGYLQTPAPPGATVFELRQGAIRLRLSLTLALGGTALLGLSTALYAGGDSMLALAPVMLVGALQVAFGTILPLVLQPMGVYQDARVLLTADGVVYQTATREVRAGWREITSLTLARYPDQHGAPYEVLTVATTRGDFSITPSPRWTPPVRVLLRQLQEHTDLRLIRQDFTAGSA
jgi:hypothetical protein